MKENILIVEDQFVEADYLRLMLKKAGYKVSGIAHSVMQAREMIKQQKPDMVLLDIYVKGKLTGIDLARELAGDNIAFIYLSANSNEEVLNAAKATRPYGFLVKPFREKDLLNMLEIARYRHEHSLESGWRKETELNEKLWAIVASREGREKKLLEICKLLQPHIPFDYITAGFNAVIDRPDEAISFLRVGFDEYQKIGVAELLTIAGLKKKDLIALVTHGSLYQLLCDTFGMESCTSIPIQVTSGEAFTLSFYSRQADSYAADHTRLSALLQRSLAGFPGSMDPGMNATGRTGTFESLAAEGSGYKPEFEGIVGNSPALLNVFDLITQVAPADTSVLILGESGTGKERIADCIHNLSPRKNKPFVKVNCAALPATLIESELFGHEKGAFTGALEKRIGKFERADQGTIFLDEIGDMPIELQVKLLRVLQERTIERIGAKDVTKVNVRIIAATNRNLEKEVAEGRFRLDLYYRLNVFPIDLPPLRARMEDLPALSAHFISYYAQKAGKKITGLSEKALKNMTMHHWPGNIRELENLIERAVLLARGTMIEDIPIPAMLRKEIAAESAGAVTKTIHEHERDYIIAVLRKCNGKVFGPGGAAGLLKIPPTTLISKMKKLGIRKESIK